MAFLRNGFKALVALAFTAQAAWCGATAPFLSWERLADIPREASVRGAFVGEHNGALLVAGGRKATGEATREIQVLAPGPDGVPVWLDGYHLPGAVAGGGAVSTPFGVVGVGGNSLEGKSADVLLIQWTPEPGVVTTLALPSLETPVEWPSVGYWRGDLFVLGPDNTLRVLDLAAIMKGDSGTGWQIAGTMPGIPRKAAATFVLSDGERYHFFVAGGVGEDGTPVLDVHRYGPLELPERQWQELGKMPFFISSPYAVVLGNAHALLSGEPVGEARDSSLWGYHSITDVWTDRAGFPTGKDAAALAMLGGRLVAIDTGADPEHGATVFLGTRDRVRGLLMPVDYLVIGCYLLGLVALGLWCSRRNTGTSDYFLAGRRIPWWAAALSLMATGVSSIGFIAIPGKAFATDWIYLSGIVTWFIVVPVVTIFFIPLIRRIDITTAYEYLESRFNLGVRLFASFLFILMQVGRTAVVLYLPALLLSSVLGMDIYLCIAVMGVVCIVYTVLGGMEAVVWSDVVQGIILFGGALLGIGIAVAGTGMGPVELYQTASADGKLRMVEWGWDPAAAVIWVVIVGNIVTRFSNLTSDQTTVQRYLSTPDTRSAVRAQWADIAFSIPWALMAFSFGTAMYLFYKVNPDKLVPGTESDAIVPLFIAQQLPVGITGLVIAAIFSATMSSLDSSIHSLSTVCVRDFYVRLSKKATEARGFLAARGLTVLFGLVGTLSAMVIAAYDAKSIWDLFLKIIGLFVGSLSGLFVLGIFFKRCNGRGALAGALVSAVAVFTSSAFTRIHFFLYPVVGILVCVITGLLASRVIPAGRRSGSR
jgi:solute:Na+ symporter, SSS family